MMKVLSFIIFLSLIGVACSKGAAFQEIFNWRTVDYVFPNARARHHAMKHGNYVPSNVFVMGLDIWRNKLLVSTPRARAGVYSAMSYIDLADPKFNVKGPSTPLLTPYPSIEDNTLPKPGDTSVARIISVYRFRVDVCDRLWLMDMGSAYGQVYTGPQILIYDLKSDKLIRRHLLKAPAAQENSVFVSITVDVLPGRCNDAFAYLPDVDGYALAVYDFKNDKSWKIKHNFFYMNPLFGEYNVAGVSLQWSDGVFGVSLGAPNARGYRNAFFHSLSSNYQNVVSTSVLRNASQGVQSSYFDYLYVGEKGPKSQTTMDDIHEKTGIMFFTQVNKNAVYCWNTNKPLNQKTMAEVASGQNMIFPADLKVIGDHVWFLTNKFTAVSMNKIDPREINYRIFAGPAALAVKGTPCAPTYNNKE